MKNVYRIIKKKKNMRRLSAVWLLLIAIELLIPAFGDQHVFAETDSAKPKTNFTASATTFDKPVCNEDSISSANDQTRNYQMTTVCHDECLCHVTPIPNLIAPSVKHPSLSSERMPIIFANPIYNSLPPPFHPPKLS